MKTLTRMALLLVLSFVSCSKQESPFDETTTTTVTGTFKDIERNRVLPNLPVYVIRTYSCGSFFAGGTCTEVIDSTLTDSQGNYTLTFPVRTLGSGYTIVHEAVRNCEELYTSEVSDSQPLVAGQTNIRNFDVWCPLVLKLALQIKNNQNPPLLVSAYSDNPETRNFPDVALEQSELDTIVYLYTRPNELTNLNFQYKLEDPNANFHFTDEWFDVGIQDTLEISRTIDCTDF